MGNVSITLSGIHQVVDNLNYKPQTVKYKAVKAILSFYTSEESVNELRSIDTDTLIAKIWDVGDAPSKIRSKRRNFSSLRSSINSDLKKLIKKDLNPENIILADTNVFDMTEEAKTSLLHSFNDAVKTGDLDIAKATDILKAVTDFLNEIDISASKDESMDILSEIKKVLSRLGGHILDEDGGGPDVEEVEIDEDEEIEEIEEDEDLEEIELDEDEEIEELDEIDEDLDVEEIELDEDEDIKEIEEDEDLEEIELDEDEEIEELDEIDEDLDVEEIELDEDEDIEEIEEDEDLEEIELDEDEDIEELDEIDEDLDVEEIELDEDEDIEEIEEDEDLEEIELGEDEDIEELDEIDEDPDVEEIELDEDEELEEIEELDEDEEIEEIQLDDDEELEEIDELDEEELAALEAFRNSRESAEHFDDTLGEREKKFNTYIKIPQGIYTVGTQKSLKSSLALQQFEMPLVYMGKYPVTNALFEIFIEQTGYITTAEKKGVGVVFHGRYEKKGKTTSWKKQAGSKEVKGACWYQPWGPGSTLHEKRNHPVVQVSVDDAFAYASWIGRRLPTEAEWEAAARTDLGYIYPWGNQFDPKAMNIEQAGISDTSSVEDYDAYSNEFGMTDMLGNVMEWTADEELPPFKTRTNQMFCVAKGGAWNGPDTVTISSRGLYKQGFTANTIGFRCISELFQ